MKKPETKIAGATTAAGVATVLSLLAAGLGLELEPTVALAAATVLVGVVGYWLPHTFRPDLGERSTGRHAAAGEE